MTQTNKAPPAHTPGPWRASKDPQGVSWYIQSQHTRHSNNSGRWADVAVVSYINRCEEDDARLIAAAPELLGAVEYVREGISNSKIFSTTCIDSELIPMLDSAIAKARGQA